jgi:hypothetical protein
MELDSLRSGAPLSSAVLRLARELGVRDAARVRIVVVDRVPLPEEGMLRAAALQVGLSQETASGMTLGYAIYARRGEEDDVRLLSHELASRPRRLRNRVAGRASKTHDPNRRNRPAQRRRTAQVRTARPNRLHG